MTSERPPRFERRHTPRATVSGNAIVHAMAKVARCNIVNLSMGGALLRSNESVALGLRFGAPIVVELHLDAADSEWMSLRGHVHRLDDDDTFCVAFHNISPQFEDVMGDEVLAALESEHWPRALVVDLHAERRRSIAAALRSAGCAVIEVATPLDAIGAIEQSHAHVEMALISEWPGGTQGALATFLHNIHPEIELVAISDRPRGAHDRVGCLFTNQPDMSRQVHRLLERVGRRRDSASPV